MKFKENDFIRVGDNICYEVMGITYIENVPGFDTNLFYSVRNINTKNRILVEAKSIDKNDNIVLDVELTREQRLNKILNDK